MIFIVFGIDFMLFKIYHSKSKPLHPTRKKVVI